LPVYILPRQARDKVIRTASINERPPASTGEATGGSASLIAMPPPRLDPQRTLAAPSVIVRVAACGLAPIWDPSGCFARAVPSKRVRGDDPAARAHHARAERWPGPVTREVVDVRKCPA
jgi:hypothetical protein